MKLDVRNFTIKKKIGSLTLDEIFIAWVLLINGQIYGMSNKQPTNTLFSVMFKSIVSKYEYVEVMVPLTILLFYISFLMMLWKQLPL